MCCLSPFVLFAIWAAAFARWEKDEGRWVLPVGELIMLILTYALPFLVSLTLSLLFFGRDQIRIALSVAMCLAHGVFLLCAFSWTTGIIAGLLIPLPCFWGALSDIRRKLGWTFKKKKGGQETASAEEMYAVEPPIGNNIDTGLQDNNM
jgi:hypothetical protein